MAESGKFFSNTPLVSSFLKDVRKFDVLTSNEEENVVNDYMNGNKSAKDLLVNCNLRYIYSEAKKYALNEDEVLDYVNEGVVGLLTALETYDISLGYKFMTYARWYIKRAMNFYLNDTKNMIVPSNNAKLGKKIDKVKRMFYADNGRDATLEEIKAMIWDEFKIDVKEDCDMYDVNVSSIDYEIDDDYTMEDNSEYNNATSSVNNYEADIETEHRKALVNDIMSHMSENERDIINMLFGIGYEREYGVDEVAEKYGVSTKNIITIRDNAFKHIRERVSRKAL